MDFTQQSSAILSLCTGKRGLERGLERAFQQLNWLPPRAIAFVEIEAFIIENLVKQMEQGVLAPTPVFSDIKTFPWHLFCGKVHGITGGYPCQPFSLAGKQHGIIDPRHLWPYIKKGVRTVKPIFCFFENVRNHLNIGYEEVKTDLEGMGYIVREGIYSAEEAGAPHKRDRLFILAILANPSSSRNPAGISEQKQREKRDTKIINHNRDRRNENVDNSFQSGLEGYTGDDRGTKGWSQQERSAPTPSLFPAGQGHFQYDWEAPRMLKSSLGTTINAYNFREDLLRMAGNGVVDVQAQIAFIDLLRKHEQ